MAKKEETKTSGKDPSKSKGSGKEPKKSKKEETVEIQTLPDGYIPRLKKMYDEQIVAELKKQFNYSNSMLIPRLDKIVLNVGVGTLHQDAKLAESLVEELGLITGQKAVFAKARKSISNFKLRQGMTVGCRVTIRHARMYELLDRLITIVIPRIRDFRGLSDRSFDGKGNYNFGVKEQIIFPEIDYDKVVKIHGMDITICTTARNDEQALALLRGFGFPFRRVEAA